MGRSKSTDRDLFDLRPILSMLGGFLSLEIRGAMLRNGTVSTRVPFPFGGQGPTPRGL